MTRYMQGGPFSVAMGGTASKKKCHLCDKELEEVIYSINKKPVCKECFNRPKNS